MKLISLFVANSRCLDVKNIPHSSELTFSHMSAVERRQGEYYPAVGLVKRRDIFSRMKENLEVCLGSISEELRNFTNLLKMSSHVSV
uniref:Uncharacterized protein n=1 Tax=Lepeophtheirus salmonis TaxID=72036 RepID=A0A0K2UZ61_LEPSM